MKKYLFFILSVILSLFFLSGKGAFFDAPKIPTAIPNVSQNVPTTSGLHQPASATPQKKLSPIVTAPAKSIKEISPKKIIPKATETLAAPLVHYTEEKTASGALLDAKIITWTNTYREQNKLKTLQRNSQLDAAAAIKVRDMFDRQYFEHVSPSGKNSADLVSGAGYEYLRVGENLALGIFSGEKDLVDAWMASPGHRANILSPHFEEIGVGVGEGIFDGKRVWLAVQEFGKPASSCPTPEVFVKTEIEKNRKKIEELSIQANNLILEINARKDDPDATAYNQKVSEYNALVAELNPLIQKTKSLVDVYNKEINEYNACIEA